ncbi:MAG TPA: hypothetical protein VE779_05055 [Candidatus Angelobacter sp.]|nr:hypothetical protein [Candidatus Angelobacter sp.]
MACLTIFVATLGLAQSHQHGHPSSAGTAPTGDVSPELETFGRAVAVQARLDQRGYFQQVLTSTDHALLLSRDLQSMGDVASDAAIVNAMSLQLRDELDDADVYNRRLLSSFTKAQDSGLKQLTKPLKKSYALVLRDARTVQQLMEPGHVVPEHLATGAANLEKALSDFRTDQIRLGRDMGIPAK